MIKDELVIRNYLSKVINIYNFGIFARLNNLTNLDNYRRIIHLLMDNLINLHQLNEISILNDSSIQEFLDNYDLRFGKSKEVTLGGSFGFNAISYAFGLEGKRTPLYNLFARYNELQSSKVSTEDLMNDESIFLQRMEFNGNSTRYSTYNDYALAFNNKILPKLLSKYKVESLDSLFPERELHFEGNVHENLRRSLSLLDSESQKVFKEVLLTVNLPVLCGVMDDKLTSTHKYANLFNNILNIDPINQTISEVVNNYLNELAVLGKFDNPTKVNDRFIHLVAATTYEYVGLNNYFSMLFFGNALYKTTRENNGQSATNNFDEMVNEVLKRLNLFKEIYLEVGKLVGVYI